MFCVFIKQSVANQAKTIAKKREKKKTEEGVEEETDWSIWYLRYAVFHQLILGRLACHGLAKHF